MTTSTRTRTHTQAHSYSLTLILTVVLDSNCWRCPSSPSFSLSSVVRRCRRRHWRHRRRLRVRDLSHFIDTQRRFWLRIAMSPYQLVNPLPLALPLAPYTAQAGGSSSSSLALAFVRIARAYFFNKFSVYSVYLFTYICYCCPPPSPPHSPLALSLSLLTSPHITIPFILLLFSLCFAVLYDYFSRYCLHFSAPSPPSLCPCPCLSVSAISFVVVFFVIEFQLVCIVDDNSSSYFAY